MWILFFILLIVVLCAFFAYSDEYKKNKSSNSVSTSSRINDNHKVMIKPISQTEPDIIKAKHLYQQAINLYRLHSFEAAVNLFKESITLLKPFKFKYPYSLEVNFYLLECYEGLNKDTAIDYGYKCLEIIKMASDREYAIAIGSYYDVCRKLYKLLIMINRITEAKDCLWKVIDITKILLESGNDTLQDSMKLTLITEGMIATHFLTQIINGKDIKNNLIAGVDSPEMWYHFDKRNSPQDAEILKQLHSIGLFQLG